MGMVTIGHTFSFEYAIIYQVAPKYMLLVIYK